MISTSPKISRVLESVRGFSPQEQIVLLEEIAALLRAALPPQPKHSVLELEGLGREIWHGIDAQAYVNQERASWDG
jgi:hypothetical protein